MEKVYEEMTSIYEENFDEEKVCFISRMIIDYPIQRLVGLSKDNFSRTTNFIK